MASRSLDDVHEDMRGLALAWLVECRRDGLDPLVYCTLRSFAEQIRLYAQGRTQPGDIVTYAKPGQSAHQYGLALDFVPIVGGKPSWDGSHPDWERCIVIADRLGLESASRWPRFREKPHLQVPQWRDHIAKVAA